MHPEGKPLVIEDEYEDSDCEDDSEQTSEPPSGAQPDKKKLPVLTKGYFPRYGHHLRRGPSSDLRFDQQLEILVFLFVHGYHKFCILKI